jgi:hypothetical protein
MSRSLRATAILTAIVAGLSLAACGTEQHTASTPTTTATPAAAAATAIRIFAAVSPSGSPTVTITSRAKGSCWEGSILTPRREAWRCTVGNEIEDPCFSGEHEAVVCPTEGPWSGKGIEILLTEPLPRNHENTGRWPSGEPTQPWALELTDGSHCGLAGGATSVVDGMRLNYFCAPDKLSLYGDPDRSSPLWTIFGGPLNAAQLTQHTIAIAWF